jgi:hypothetical protein
MDWFFGKMSSKEAVQALSASKAHIKEDRSIFKRKKPCFFLVRESAGTPLGDKDTKGTRTKGSVKAKYEAAFCLFVFVFVFWNLVFPWCYISSFF